MAAINPWQDRGPLGWEAQVHRETYIAVLKSQLREPGSKQRFAAQVSITPQYLSYLLDPYNHRTPSPQVAERMAQALALSNHERDHVLENMLLAGDHQGQFERNLREQIAAGEALQTMTKVMALHDKAKFADTAVMARAYSRMAALAGRDFIHQVNPWRHPVEYADVAIVMHEICCVRNQMSRALYYAKRARVVLQGADPAHYQKQVEHHAHSLTNAIRSEAVAYHNLDLDSHALALLDQAETTPDVKQRPHFWLPHLYRDKLASLVELRRFRISEAEGLTQQGLEQCALVDGEEGPLLALLLERGLAGAYLRTARLRQAEGILRRLLDEMEQVPRLGMLHRVLTLVDYGKALWQQQDRSQWREVIAHTMTLAAQSGLQHQLTRLRDQYGDALNDVLVEVDAEVVQALPWQADGD